MGRDVDAAVGPAGWTTWDRLVAQLSPATVRAWVVAGRLVHLDTGVYASPRADWRTRAAAVAQHRRGVVSAGTALALWGLVPPQRGPVHLSVARVAADAAPAA